MGEIESFEETVRKIAEKKFADSSTFFRNRTVSHFRVHAGSNADLEGVKKSIEAMYEDDLVAKTAWAMDSVPEMRIALLSINDSYSLSMTRMAKNEFKYEGRLLSTPMEDMQHDPTDRRAAILSFYVR